MDTASILDKRIAGPMLRPAHAVVSLDHDIAEIAIGFGRRFGAAPRAAAQDFGAATQGGVTFRKVDPLREPFEVADRRLQSRLETLCETLRAKY